MGSKKDLSRRLSRGHTTIDAGVLKERTPSSINASQTERQRHDVSLNGVSNREQEGKSSSILSADFENGTVQHKFSPTRRDPSHDTPEWKRRILQGKAGAADQTDLFGPIGLENVFKPPTAVSKISQAFQSERKATMPIVLPSIEPQLHDGLPTALAAHVNAEIIPQEGRGDKEHVKIIKTIHSDPLRNSQSINNLPRVPLSPKEIFAENAVVVSDSMETVAHTEQRPEQSKGDFNSSKNENISPFYISKHHTFDGKVDYAAIDMSLRTLQNNIETSQRFARRLSNPNLSDIGINSVERGQQGASEHENENDNITSHSLPTDLSVGTDAFIANGGFINVHRGGYSNDGSFQRRSLSPSSSLNTAGASQEFSIAQVRSEGVQTPDQSAPRTPQRKNLQKDSSPDRPTSSGSPLKLFDKHDTFTANRLARRMSKFEETLGHAIGEDDPESTPPPSFTPSPSPKKAQGLPGHDIAPTDYNRRISSFGEGDLDEHTFPLAESSDYQLPEWPLRDTNLKLTTTPSKGVKDGQKQRGNLTHPNERSQDRYHRPQQSPSLSTEGQNSKSSCGSEDEVFSIHGKRLFITPLRTTSMKRRKTLESSRHHDGSLQDLELHRAPSQADPNPTNSGSGRKRKDARYDDEAHVSDPTAIASRQKRQPRQSAYNRQPPTQESVSFERSFNDERDDLATEVTSASLLRIDPPTQIVAGALASVALNAVQDITSGSRKTSVATSDFFKEAQQIMALIRADTRPKSSHTTTENSEGATPSRVEKSFQANSTMDSFSRPPSRQGGAINRLPDQPNPDARVISHLRKFEDEDDLGLSLPPSLHSLKINHSEEVPRIGQDDMESPNAEILYSDPPNIRIRGIPTETVRKEETIKHHSQDQAERRGVDSLDSARSSAPTEVRTGSSHSSVTIRKIAPESVAHLLSDQMADMAFDHERKVWVKNRSSDNQQHESSGSRALNELSQDDLLGDIPDLSIDEMEELRRVKDVVSQVGKNDASEHRIDIHDHAVEAPVHHERQIFSAGSTNKRPRTAEGKSIPAGDDSSAPSKYSNFAWSGPMPGTRATSYGDDAWPQKRAPETETQPVTAANYELRQTKEEVEHEFSILEGRESPTSRAENVRNCQPRVVTVSFSSPLVRSPAIENNIRRPFSHAPAEDDLPFDILRPAHSSHRIDSVNVLRGSTRKGALRRASIGNSSLIARPMSRLDEEDDFYMVHASESRGTADLSHCSPQRFSKSLMLTPLTGRRNNTCLDLSPLPDFTMHQVDRPVDDDDDDDVIGQVLLDGSRTLKKDLSLTAQDLVRHLTDLEPYEPYWEYLRHVNLSGRSLTSVHLLDEFCGLIQELDLSSNQIRELQGVPPTVRMLDIHGNSLSDLTAWHNLLHLQYLDVSGNGLHSLAGLAGLVHLRSLKAENNHVECLDGIGNLDALLCLSVAGNDLRLIDFEGFNL